LNYHQLIIIQATQNGNNYLKKLYLYKIGY